ncbi:hypothetical protein HPB48_012207 [Haemaphysalis longicornis]|uniref:Glycoside hydrolase family 31 TIM barrel domain-containing protein n=1 Tax=Haemaphysalis longicornis TaxID=44386 RepID=A0A9J6FUI6_HAELO|nr:hypothetical protein HPB48_012207 [Haemaphysalis longicornis]
MRRAAEGNGHRRDDQVMEKERLVPESKQIRRPHLQLNCRCHLLQGVDLALSPGRTATFRVSGGVLDFFVILGSSPGDVVSQYVRLVGLPPLPKHGVVPPTALQKISAFMPLDDSSQISQVVDLTHPDGEQEWRLFLRQLKDNGSINFLQSLHVLPPKCIGTWTNAEKCQEQKRDSGLRYSEEVCGTAQLHLSRYADVRNAYGYLTVRAVYRFVSVVTGIPPLLLISKATFPGIGKWSSYWVDAPDSDAKGVEKVLGDMLLFSILGIHSFGVRLCRFEGVIDDETHDICCLWLNLAIFMPLIHSVDIPADIGVSTPLY